MQFFSKNVSGVSGAEEGLEMVDLRSEKNCLKRGVLRAAHTHILPFNVSAPQGHALPCT